MRRASSRSLLVVVLGLLFASCGTPARQKVGWQVAPDNGEIAPYVASALQTAQQQRRQLLVYVGAKWCEPCRRFHDAVAAGKLDGTFPQLDLVEYDLDRDEARLSAAGYRSQYIPLFARPNADGKGSGRQFAGSIKGEAAIADLEKKLTSLLAN